MTVSHINTNRRSFLKGVTLGAGAVVLQPVLRALAAEAAGEEAPRRVVFVLEGNGLFPNHIQPQGLQRPKWGSEQLIDRSLADYKLPDPIAPLAPVKDRMTIIQGLSSQVSSSDHSTCYGALGCYPGKFGPKGQTIDSALSDSLPGIFPVLALGLARTSQQAVAYNFSATGPGKPIAIHCRPDRAFETLFSSVADGNAAKKGELRSHFLDYMASDVRRVRTALAGPERERLDSYLESYESLRKRETQISGIRDDLKTHKPNPDKFASDSETDRWESHIDLAASSLLAGLTNVVTLSTETAPNYYTTWNGLGIPIDGHKIGHMTGHNGRTAEELSVIIRQYIAKQIARLATRLDSVKEGNGTVLDNTLIVYMSDAADQHHSYHCKQWPMVLIGNLGGKLKTNRFLEFPKYGANGHRTTGNCFLSLLHAVGDRREKFGAEDFDLKGIDTNGPLAEVLA